MQNTDYTYWNTVKGLGIIAIVVGHTGSPFTPYMYMYHLALFFFISGFLYKQKYSADPFNYFTTRLRRLWWPMTKYGIVFVLLHNIFLKIGVYSSVDKVDLVAPIQPYSMVEIMLKIKSTILMQTMEQMGCAMWFVQSLLVAMVLFCCIQKLSAWGQGGKAEVITVSLVLICGIVGVVLLKKKVALDYFAEVGLLVIPIIYCGYVTHRLWEKIPFKWYLALAAAIYMIGVYQWTGKHVNLSIKEIIGSTFFYTVSVAGIYLNLYLARTVKRSHLLRDGIARLGENSFHIMALHFLSFKIMSAVYIVIYDKPIYWIAKFPIIDTAWWIPYTVCGLVIPVIVIGLGKKTLSGVSKIIN